VDHILLVFNKNDFITCMLAILQYVSRDIDPAQNRQVMNEVDYGFLQIELECPW